MCVYIVIVNRWIMFAVELIIFKFTQDNIKTIN